MTHVCYAPLTVSGARDSRKATGMPGTMGDAVSPIAFAFKEGRMALEQGLVDSDS